MESPTENSVGTRMPSLSTGPAPAGHRLERCPICDGSRLDYVISADGLRIVRCGDCRLVLVNPQPEPNPPATALSAAPFQNMPEASPMSQARRVYARLCLREIARYNGKSGGALVQVGCGEGDWLVEAREQGYSVAGVEPVPSRAEQVRDRLGVDDAALVVGSAGDLGGRKFDLCILADTLERASDPLALLSSVRELLEPDGVLFVSTPPIDSASWPPAGGQWEKTKSDQLYYFDGNTIQHILFRAGYHQVIVEPAVHWQGADDAYKAARRMMVMARPAPRRERRILSVIVPAYNEGGTFDELMAGLVRKEMPGLDLEIVVVESNSTDGTRAIAQKYQNHPRVRLVWEDRPLGKGHAVRQGLEQATGDFVIIQDADLEYDLEDYAVLLAPLVKCQQAFVLGSRHGGSWKIRHFAGQSILTLFFNGGHWFFTFLVDLLFGLRLRDPFTMYKVFRRDCLYGLRLECNRFDFDYELLVKLVAKGYRPIEIPVNYRSRSFQEGKKISVLRDPLNWLWALLRLRLAQVDPMREIERQRHTPTP